MGNAQEGGKGTMPQGGGNNGLEDMIGALGDILVPRPSGQLQPQGQLIPIPIPVEDDYGRPVGRQQYPQGSYGGYGDYGRYGGQGGYYRTSVDQSVSTGEAPKKMPLFNIKGLNNQMKIKQQEIGDAVQGITINIKSNMENIGITEDQLKNVGSIIPIIASVTVGRAGVFSSKVPQTIMSRSMPRALRMTPVAVRQSVEKMSKMPMKAGQPVMQRVSPFSTNSLRLRPCLFSPAPMAKQQVQTAASARFGQITSAPPASRLSLA